MAGLTFLLARSIGAAEQGAFYAAKSAYDLLVTCFIFGFPQSIILVINRNHVSRYVLYRQTLGYSFIILVVLSIISSLLRSNLIGSYEEAVIASFSVAAIVAAYLIRAIYITVDDGLRYSLMTTAPTFFLAISCLSYVGLFGNISHHVSEIFFWSAIGTGSATYLLAQPKTRFELEGSKPSSKRLLVLGMDAFLLSLAATGQVFITYEYLKINSTGQTLGFFSVALAASNILAFPLQALSPILLSRWSAQGGDASREGMRPSFNLWRIMAIAALGIYIAIVLGPDLILHITGAEYIPAIVMIQLMIAYTLITFIQRIASLKLAATGNIRFGGLVAISKIVFIAIALYMLSLQAVLNDRAGEAVCCVWLIAEVIAAFVTVRKVTRAGLSK